MINFLTKFRIPVILVFFACQYIWFTAGANLLDWDSISLPALMSLLFLTGFWLALLLDMINTRIFNKTFWLMSMLILPFIAPAIYLLQRKKLQHLKTTPFTRE